MRVLPKVQAYMMSERDILQVREAPPLQRRPSGKTRERTLLNIMVTANSWKVDVP